MQNMRQGMVSIFLQQALQNNEIIVKGSKERFRDFIYIDDVVDGFIEWKKMMKLAIGVTISQIIKKLLLRN